MRHFILIGLSSLVIISFNSCSGCVKDISKSVTEVGISAVEGAVEAVDEHGERIAEKTTDAAGKMAVGAGRSLDKQLDEHAAKVISVVGRTTVQSIDGFEDGINNEVKKLYTEFPYTEKFVSGVSLDLFGKYKSTAVIDAYFLILEKGAYTSEFEFINNAGKVFLTKNIDIDKTTNREYTRISFALNGEEELELQNLKNVEITVSKK